jgi:hypothetical protein
LFTTTAIETRRHEADRGAGSAATTMLSSSSEDRPHATSYRAATVADGPPGDLVGISSAPKY